MFCKPIIQPVKRVGRTRFPKVAVVLLTVLLAAEGVAGLEGQYRFRIDRQPVEDALNELANQADVLLLFPYDKVLSVDANSVNGLYTIPEALDILLKDTGLSGSLTAGGVITIQEISSSNNQPKGNQSMALAKKSRPGIKRLAAAILAVFSGSSVVAATETGYKSIEEVVVTAQKRRQSINDVPMSITALSGDQLEEKGIKEVSDLQKVVSGFRYAETYAGTPIYYIRGIGFNELSLGALPNVAVYVDEVAIPFPIMTGGVALDLERVEVLKGPQGTLFGQSSTAGAINYIAAKPTDTFESAITLGYGSYSEKLLDGYLSGPLSSNLKARLAFNVQKSDGWQESTTRNDELGAKDKRNVRLLLDWQATDQLDFSLNLSSFKDKSEIRALQYQGNEWLSVGYPLIPEPYQSQIQNYIVADDNEDADWGPRTPEQDSDFTQASLRTTYDFADGKQLVYIISKADFDINRFTDPDGLAFNNFEYRILGDISSTSHELRLSGEAVDNRLQWMVGVNYDNSEVDELDQRRIDFSSSNYALGSYFSRNDTVVRQDFTSKAVFAALDFDISEQFIAHVSARHTRTEDEFSGCTKDSGDGLLAAAYNFALGLSVAPGECTTFVNGFVTGMAMDSLEEDNTSWRVGVDWTPNDETLIYGNVTKGYKAGSFPALAATDAVQFTPVTQESLLAYEVGIKKYFIDQNLQFNAAVFYYDYNDKQVRGRIGPTLFGYLEALVNVPESEVRGAELDMTWRITPNLVANINGIYVDSEIEGDFVNFTDFGIQDNFTGEAFPNTPKIQANADLEYSWTLANGYGLFVGGHVMFQDDTYKGFGEDPRLKIDSYTVVDLRAGIDSADETWRLTLWGHNITDKDYSVMASRVSDTYVHAAGNPRSVGVNFTYYFQ